MGRSPQPRSGQQAATETSPSPEQLSAEILGELKRIAEMRLGHAVQRAVITVPAYFHDAQRQATKRAGELAGLDVVRIINEPTAAALAYGLDQLAERSRIAVYDLGGGTFDISILEMQGSVYEVLATHGDTRLGGDDIDLALAQYVAETTATPWHELPESSQQQWLRESSRVKCLLSEQTEALWHDDQRGISHAISREVLESLMQPLIARTIQCCQKALNDSRGTAEEIRNVILVGGSTRIPAVRDAVERCFGRKPDLSQHPDEAIALGATIHAGVLSGALRKMTLLDVTPLSLGIETLGGLMNVIIPRNSTIPCKAGEMFTNAVAGQHLMKVRILQGEREMARDNWELGLLQVSFEPAPKGQARVGIQFRIDENGILEVLARDVATGRDNIMQIHQAAVDVSDENVERMISASIDHAFGDMAERVLTEAQLKAEELLPAVDEALRIGASWLDDAEKSRINAAAAAVRDAMDMQDHIALKAAVQVLDKATEALAARIVEHAMENL
jgi:molecular chaperone DnaK